MSELWLINQYATPPELGPHVRHHHLAAELARRGHSVHLVTGAHHHLQSEAAAGPAPFLSREHGYAHARVPTVRYAHAHDRRRVLSWLAFSRAIPRLEARGLPRPDAVLYSSPSLPGARGAERAARRAGARFAFEVRDIWPLSMVEVGGISPRHPFVRWMQRIEDRAYARADRVLSNLRHAVDHMEARGMDRAKFRWIPNGVHEDDVAGGGAPLGARIAESLPEGRFTVGYAGTLGEANGLDHLLDAAGLLREREDIAFAVVGRGRLGEELRAEAARRGLSNIVFPGSVPKAEVPALLARFDACYIGLKAAPLFRFGVSPNKLFDYMRAARPVIYAIDSGAYRPVSEAGAGIEVPPGDPAAIAEAVRRLADMPQAERAAMGEAGRAHVAERHDYAVLAGQLEEALLGRDGA